jgi:hypothetical protein
MTSRTLLSLCSLLAAAHGVEVSHRFTGIESCATSGCHGGGQGRNQVQIHKKDQHANAQAAMMQAAWATQLVQNLGITNPYQSARCNVCHSPLLTVHPDKFVPDLTPAKAGQGVSCESCHGPAEFWLRSHTRPDYTHALRTQIGLRDLKSLYGRANACVGCHQNIDPEIVAKGHVPLTFELDDFDTRETAHWKDEGAWLGPRRWLTGQAVALREVSWQLAKNPATPGSHMKPVQDRAAALAWLLRKTEAGAKALPSGADHAALQTGADRLARAASAEAWTKDSTLKLFRTLVGTSREFGPTNAETAAPTAQRGFLLAVALRRLHIALKTEGNLVSPNIEKSIESLFEFTKSETAFDGGGYSRMLEQIEVELTKL